MIVDRGVDFVILACYASDHNLHSGQSIVAAESHVSLPETAGDKFRAHNFARDKMSDGKFSKKVIYA